MEFNNFYFAVGSMQMKSLFLIVIVAIIAGWGIYKGALYEKRAYDIRKEESVKREAMIKAQAEQIAKESAAREAVRGNR
jgi:hypothetical protein